MPTVSGHMRRSFYPESVLVQRRDSSALWIKHRFGASRRIRGLWNFSHLPRDGSSPNLEVYERNKKIGELLVSTPALAPATGYDSTNNVTIDRYSQQVIGLHLDAIRGPRQIRRDMADAATYIHNLPPHLSRPHVVGVTYAEMARFAFRLGFREMEKVYDLDITYAADVAAVYRVFCQFGNREEQSCVPAMVYLPTEDFVRTYNPQLVDTS